MCKRFLTDYLLVWVVYLIPLIYIYWQGLSLWSDVLLRLGYLERLMALGVAVILLSWYLGKLLVLKFSLTNPRPFHLELERKIDERIISPD